MTLPPELWLHILTYLSDAGEVSLASHHVSKRSARLATLCLVSHAFNVLAEPLLYSTGFVTAESLEPFARTVICTHDRPTEPRAFTPSRKGKLVYVLSKIVLGCGLWLTNFHSRTRLAFVHFPARLTLRQMGHLTGLLYALRSCIQTLYLSMPFKDSDLRIPLHEEIGVNVNSALASLDSITEFYATSWVFLRWSTGLPIPQWGSLRRMALNYVGVDDAFVQSLSQMTSIDICVVIIPRSLEISHQDSVTLQQSERGTRIIVANPSYFLKAMEMEVSSLRSTSIIQHKAVQNMPISYDQSGWMLDRMIAGDMWAFDW